MWSRMEARTKRINIPVTETELAALKRAAHREERTLADFLRRAGSIIAFAGEDGYPEARRMLDGQSARIATTEEDKTK